MREVVQVSATMRIIEQALGIAGDALVGLRGPGKWRPRDTCEQPTDRRHERSACDGASEHSVGAVGSHDFERQIVRHRRLSHYAPARHAGACNR
jgi:hypothetical protein